MEAKTQKQNTELILYRLDELTRSTTAQFNTINAKLDNQPSVYLMRSEFDAFKKSVRVNYVGVMIIVATLVTILYHILKIRP